MKIALVCFRYPLYENGSYLQEFVDALALKVESITIIANHFPSKPFPSPPNVVFKWIPYLSIPFFGDLLFNVAVFVRCFSKEFFQADVINTLSARGAPAAYIFSRLTGKPIVSTVEIINRKNDSLLDNFINFSQHLIYTLPYDRIISWSHYYFERYLKKWGIKTDRVDFIPSGIDTKRYSPQISGQKIRHHYKKTQLFIVFAKPLYEYNRKMAELLVRAVNHLRPKLDLFLLIGRGEQEERIQTLINRFDLNDRVSFMPFVSIKAIPGYLAAADIIVLPYTYAATTSRSLLEAMAMGKPVITTAAGEITRVVTNGVNALVTKASPIAIAETITLLSKDSRLQKELGRNARHLVEKEYSIEKIIEKTLSVYQSLLT